MKKKTFSVHQIAKILKEFEEEKAVDKANRRNGKGHLNFTLMMVTSVKVFIPPLSEKPFTGKYVK